VSGYLQHGGMPPPQWITGLPGGPQPYVYHEGQAQFIQQPQQQHYEGLQMPQQLHNQPPVSFCRLYYLSFIYL
jgi:hypothetical protein